MIYSKQNGRLIKDDDKIFQILNTGKTLRVKNFKTEYEEGLICVGQNSLGSAKRGFHVKMNMTPRWTEFSDWSACNVTCGNGYQDRSRECRLPDGKRVSDTLQCFGQELEERLCEQKECFGWSEWSPWSPCSKTCGTGYAVKERTCNDPFLINCEGEPKIYKYCIINPC